MPNFESNFSNKLISSNFELANSSDCFLLDDSVGGKMNLTVYLSNGEHDHRDADTSYGGQMNDKINDKVNDKTRIESREILNDAKCDEEAVKCQPNRTTQIQASLHPFQDDLAVSKRHSETNEIQPILKPIHRPVVSEWIEMTAPQPSNEMNLSLKTTLHHALKSNYAYLPFQDSFNIQDYQSFDSTTSSTKLANAKHSPYLTSLDASFSTSMDTIDLVRQLENDQEKQLDVASGKQSDHVLRQTSIDSQAIKESKSSQSIRDLEEGLSTGKEPIRGKEPAKELDNKDNYLYNETDKRKFQFRSFVDAIRVSDKDLLYFLFMALICLFFVLPLRRLPF